MTTTAPKADANGKAPEPAFDWDALASTATVDESLKQEPLKTEDDVPTSLRALVDKAWEDKLPRKMPVKDAKMAKTLVSHLRTYGQVRKAGRVTVRILKQTETEVGFKVMEFKTRGPNAKKDDADKASADAAS